MKRINRFFAHGAFVSTLTLIGCANLSSPFAAPPSPVSSQASAKIGPRVQNCGVLNTGTPSRFVCNGKVYTSYQLAKLREDEAKKSASTK